MMPSYGHKNPTAHGHAFRRDEAAAIAMLRAGANMYDCSPNGYTVGHHAAGKNLPNLLRLLIGRGFDWSLQAGDGSTPFHLAVHSGHKNIVNLLLNKGGVDVNLLDGDDSPAFLRVCTDDTDMLKYLLRRKADPNLIGDRNGYSLLYWMASQRQLGHVKLLLRYKANPNLGLDRRDGFKGFTTLHVAASRGYLEICQVLIAAGAGTNTLDAKGRTPAQVARDFGRTVTSDYLRTR